MVSKGAIEAAFSGGVYHAAKGPEFFVEIGLPLTFTNPEQVYECWFDYKDGKLFEIYKEAYAEHGCYYLTPVTSSSYGLMTKFPVNTIEDFKGKKIRSWGAFTLLVKELGGSPVSLPGAEQYVALQRGTVDGTIYALRSLEDYKLKEVVDYIIYPPLMGQVTINLYCNKKAYESLPSDIRKILDEVSIEWAKNVYKPGIFGVEKECIEKAVAIGVKEVTLPEEEVDKMRKICEEKVWPVYAAKNPRCKEIIDLMLSYLREKGVLK